MAEQAKTASAQPEGPRRTGDEPPSGVPSSIYGVYRGKNIRERFLEISPRYVALKDLFLPQQEDVKVALMNHQLKLDLCLDLNALVKRSYSGGECLKCESAEIREQNRIAKRLEFSDFESKDAFVDVDDACRLKGHPEEDVCNAYSRSTGPLPANLCESRALCYACYLPKLFCILQYYDKM
ncbi:hypothetical protein KM043_013358 [Ampulex compressa]|nr:hypothetical protein KM043_013358 [Ampulex compressa]